MIWEFAAGLDNKESVACRKDGNTNIENNDKYKYKGNTKMDQKILILVMQLV